MATLAQIEANRANALKSTGPRTAEGKSASSRNALKHGMDAASIVIPGEDPAEYESLASACQRDCDPHSALEQFQVDTIIRCDWQRRRLKRVEAKLYRAIIAEGQDPDDIDVGIFRDSPTGKLLRKVFAQIASLERAHACALAELRCLRAEREQAPVDEIDRLRDMPGEFVNAFAARPEPEFPGNEPNFAPQSASESPALDVA